MSALAFSLRYAVRSLRRSGQRGALAVACIAFGVFSLVGLQLMAASIEAAVLLPPRVALGGDLGLSRDGRVLSPADLDALTADPDIRAVDARADVPAQFIQTADNARLFIFSRIQAVDPAVYPLVGAVRMRAGTLAAALSAPESVVLSRDLAGALGVAVGDRVRLAGAPGGVPAVLVVGGLADMLPDAQGGTVLMSRQTAQALSGADVVTSAFVRTDAGARVAARYEAAGWTVRHPTEAPNRVQELFGVALPAAGLLGLLLGGIGVANTLQVMLTRRRPEVAVLKTLGYRQRDLLALFGLETALLGLAGGVLGVVLGIAGAEALRQIMARGLPILLDFHLVPSVLVGGLAAGVVTAVLFGLIAIVRASSVRPGTLLRQTPIRATARARLVTVVLWLALFLLFGGLGSLLVGSVVYGFGVVAGGVAGLLAFGALLVGVLWLAVRIPTPGLPFLSMAASNLGRHPARAAPSLVALFAGTFAIGLSALSILNSQEQVTSRMVEAGQANVAVYGIPADDPELVRLAADAGASVWTDQTAPAEVLRPDGTPFELVSSLHGRGAEGASAIAVSDSARGDRGGAWLADPDGALVPRRLGTGDHPVAVGDSLQVRVGETSRTLVVDGYYGRPDGIPLVPTSGVVVLPETFASFAPEGITETVALEVPPARTEALVAALGRARPGGAVIAASAVADMIVRVVRGLFWLVLALTSLALIAGTVLIANGVGLALVERRREIGVLKAVGYSAGQVMRVLTLENALLGGIGGGLGVGAAALTLVVFRRSAEVPITIYPGVTIGLVGVAVLLAAGSAWLVAWRAVHARPLDVLRAD